MLTKEQIRESARLHHEAEKSRRPMCAYSRNHPELSIEDAYRVQDAWMDLKLEEGRKVIGRKIGLTSRAMQEAMKIEEPDFGTLLDNMLFENGARIPAADFIDPYIEVEFTFVLKKALSGENLGEQDVMIATDYILPSLELIAARSHRIDPETGYIRKVTDTISDNAANAGIIVGTTKIDPGDFDPRWAGAILYRNDIVEKTGLAAGVMDHPARGITWLAKRFAPFGIALEPGQYIMSGSFTRPVPVRADDEFRADFGPYGLVEIGFS